MSVITDERDFAFCHTSENEFLEQRATAPWFDSVVPLVNLAGLAQATY